MQKYERYSSKILRIGIGLVIIWFGLTQLWNPDPWTGFLPGFLNDFLFSPTTWIYLNGWFEAFAGLLLVMGLFIRYSAGLLAIHLLFISISLGYTPLAIRDIGLTIAMISIFLKGEDEWSVDNILYEEEMDEIMSHSK